MSNLIIDDDEINLKKRPPIPPIASYDECDRAIQVAPPVAANLSSSSSSSSLNTITLAPIQKHYNNDNSENYASENNLLTKCCNGTSSVVISSSKPVETSSAHNLNSINGGNGVDDDVCTKSTSNIFNKQPQATTNLSNTNRNRLRLSLSNGSAASSSTSATPASNQPAVHGRNNANGLPTGRTRLSTHQRNLSLDFR